MEKICDLEHKININIDMLEVAKGYCDCNCEKSIELSAIRTALGVILNNQIDIANDLDEILLENKKADLV